MIMSIDLPCRTHTIKTTK